MIDFKSFKKVSEDSDKAILQNEAGHKIHLVKSALSPVLQKRLSKLPLHQAEPDSQVGDTAPSDDGGDQWQPDHKAQQPVVVNVNNGPQGGYPSQNLPQSAAQGVEAGAGGMAPVVPQNILSSTGGGNALQPPPPQAQAPQAAAPQPNPVTASEGQMGGYGSVPGFAEQQAGIQGASKAQQELGQQQAKMYQDNLKQQQDAFNAFQSDQAAKMKEMQGVSDDIRKGHIEPNHYMESKSAPQRIATAIGLLLGGISSGQTGQPNPVAVYLNQQINRDLEAQKQGLQQKDNLYSALQNQYKDRGAAESMFRAIRSNMLADQVASAGASAQGQMAKAQAMQSSGVLKQQASQYLRQASLAQLQSNASGGSAGPESDQAANRYLRAARVLDPKGAEEFEKRYVPGVGVAQVPLEKDDREFLQSKTDLHALLGQAQDYLEHAGSLPAISPTERAKATAIQTQINLKMGELANLKRFTPEENKLYQSLTPDLTGSHFTNADMTKLKQLQSTNDGSLNNFYKEKGFRVRSMSPSAPVVGVDGKKYRKGPDGKMYPE